MFETSGYKIQKPGTPPKESIQQCLVILTIGGNATKRDVVMSRVLVAVGTVLNLKSDFEYFARIAEFRVTRSGDKRSGTAVCVWVAAVRILQSGNGSELGHKVNCC